MISTKRIFEGTWEEISRQAGDLAGMRLRVEVLGSEAAPRSDEESPRAGGLGNLAELLGDYVGAVKGTGEALSERTGERFTEYLAQKYREGRL